MGMAEPVFAAGATVTRSQDYTLTAADVAATPTGQDS